MPSLVTRFHLLLLAVTLAMTGVALFRIPTGFVFTALWDAHSRPDWLWPREYALAGGPIIAIALIAIFFVIGKLLTRNHMAKVRHILEPALSLLLGVVAAVQLGMLLTGIGSDIDLVRIVAVGLGALLVVLGIVVAEAERHTYAGLRMPWPIRADRAWVLVHRLTGIAFGLGGVGVLALAWLRPDLGPLVIGFALALGVPVAVAAMATLATRALAD